LGFLTQLNSSVSLSNISPLLKQFHNNVSCQPSFRPKHFKEYQFEGAQFHSSAGAPTRLGPGLL